MKQKVMVLGSAVVDLMARTPHLPVPGETVRGSSFRQSSGGKGLNQGIAACKSGGDVDMVMKLGRDTLAEVPLRAMDEAGLRRDCVFYHETVATGVSLINVDEGTSQNEIVIVPGACATLTGEDLDAISGRLKASAYLLLQLEINQDANEAAARLAKANGVRVILNPAPCQPLSDDFLNGLYLVTPNEVEVEALTGVAVTDQASADRAAQVLFDKGVQHVLITLGGRGVYLNTEGRSEIIPAYRVDAVDTTGAGDAFNGGLLTALSEGKPLREAARFANALAALSVQRYGAAPSMPTREEIEAFLAAHGA